MTIGCFRCTYRAAELVAASFTITFFSVTEKRSRRPSGSEP